jgi:hypothetical protein
MTDQDHADLSETCRRLAVLLNEIKFDVQTLLHGVPIAQVGPVPGKLVEAVDLLTDMRFRMDARRRVSGLATPG